MDKRSVPKSHPQNKPESQARRVPVLFHKGAALFGEVLATRFRLVDDSGRMRGGLGFSDSGDPMVFVSDDPGGGKDQIIRAQLVTMPEGSALLLSDAKGTSRARITVKESGITSILLNDATGGLRFSAMLGEHGTPDVLTFDSQGQPWRLVQQPGRKPTLRQIGKIVERAVEHDGKRGFIRAMGETLGVYDHADLAKVWNEFRRDTPQEPKAKAKPRASRVKGGAA